MQKIEKEKIILVEGKDEQRFFISACEQYKLNEIQVIDFGGIKELNEALKIIINNPKYHQLKTMIIARDAETDANSAIRSIQSSLKNHNLPVPSSPFLYVKESSLRIAYVIFPGVKGTQSEQDNYVPGTLEDLCISLLNNTELMNCVENYLNCAGRVSGTIRHPHKAKLYAYLAGLDGFAGLKLGEAADKGAWNWNHPALEPFRNILSNM